LPPSGVICPGGGFLHAVYSVSAITDEILPGRYRHRMMTIIKSKEDKEPMCVNDRTAVEAIASILRHLVTNGLI